MNFGAVGSPTNPDGLHDLPRFSSGNVVICRDQSTVESTVKLAPAGRPAGAERTYSTLAARAFSRRLCGRQRPHDKRLLPTDQRRSMPYARKKSVELLDAPPSASEMGGGLW